MLGNIVCWVIALALILSKASLIDDFYTRLLFAMGFIFLGILSKTADYYGTRKTSADDRKSESKTVA
jgi:hypothetical protein